MSNRTVALSILTLIAGIFGFGALSAGHALAWKVLFAVLLVITLAWNRHECCGGGRQA